MSVRFTCTADSASVSPSSAWASGSSKAWSRVRPTASRRMYSSQMRCPSRSDAVRCPTFTSHSRPMACCVDAYRAMACVMFGNWSRRCMELEVRVATSDGQITTAHGPCGLERAGVDRPCRRQIDRRGSGGVRRPESCAGRPGPRAPRTVDRPNAPACADRRWQRIAAYLRSHPPVLDVPRP